MSWLTPEGGAGYFALGYDDYFATRMPIWHERGEKLLDVAIPATQWAQEGIEVNSNRRVEIFYVTDDCKVQENPDIVISTTSTPGVS